MWMNDGKFLDNARCGFILKPDYMVNEKSKWSPNSGKPVKTLVLKVRAFPFPFFPILYNYIINTNYISIYLSPLYDG